MYVDNGIWKWKYAPTANKSTGYEDIISTLNITTPADFKASTPEQQDAMVDEVLKKIREVNIYPIYYYTDEGIRREILECAYTSTSFTGNTLNVTTKAGATLLDFMFPNMHLAESGNAINNNLYSRFYDDKKLSKCLHRYMSNYKFTSMRSMFFMYGKLFWNTAANFNMGRAKAIYNRLLPGGGTIYDFSSGFGSRMLAALTDLRVDYKYIGCEPDSNTCYNLSRLGQYTESTLSKSQSFELHNTGSEILELPNASIDLAFSCPPYFALERYTKEDTQSYNKYPMYEDWLNGYVLPTLSNIYHALKPGGTLGFVIGDVWYRNKPMPLRKDWCDAAKHTGFTPVGAIPVETKSRKQSGGDTLFIFRKDTK